MSTYVTPEVAARRREQVIELTRAGVSARDIATRLRITERTVQRIRARAGISQGAATPLTADELAQAAAMFADGCSREEVARTIGRSTGAMKRHFPDQAWTRAEVGMYSATVRYMATRLGIGA